MRPWPDHRLQLPEHIQGTPFLSQQMAMNRKLKAQLDRAFELTHDLMVHLDEDALALDLPALPSNRIAGQVWCIVGARESYTRAIEKGTWAGFSCTLDEPRIRFVYGNGLTFPASWNKRYTV